MITLKSNTFNLFGRVIMLILITLIIYLVTTGKIINENRPLDKFLLTCLLLTLILAFILVTVSFLGIIKVEVDKISALITLSGLFSTRIINNRDIVGYYNSFSLSRRKTFYGIILLLDDNESFELIEYNLKTIEGLEQYLKDINVKCLGKVRSRFPFKKRL